MQGSPCKVVFPQIVQTLNGILLDLCCPITWLAIPFLGVENLQKPWTWAAQGPTSKSRWARSYHRHPQRVHLHRSYGQIFSLVVSQELVGIHEWRCILARFGLQIVMRSSNHHNVLHDHHLLRTVPWFSHVEDDRFPMASADKLHDTPFFFHGGDPSPTTRRWGNPQSTHRSSHCWSVETGEASMASFPASLSSW